VSLCLTTQYSMTTQIIFNATLALNGLTTTNTTQILAKGVRMKQQFQVVYETKGVKVVNVWLPEGTELPIDWHTMSYREQDEWLYENQDEAHLQWSDEQEGKAVNVLPVAQLKAVV
jgi:hypothetical protein